MRVGHYAPFLHDNIKTGIGWYVYNLLLSLIPKSSESEIYAFDLLCRNGIKDRINHLFADSSVRNKLQIRTVSAIPSTLYARMPSLFSGIPFDTFFDSHADIHHAHNYFLPYRLKTPSVLTIYDMVYQLYPETMAPSNYKLLSKILPRSSAEATHILTISNNSKKEISDLLRIEEKRITVAYPAYNSHIFKKIDKGLARKQLSTMNITKPFILYLGTVEPRKNIERIIRAFYEIHFLYPDIDLVIAGTKGWKSDNIYALVEQLKLSKNIRFTGYVDQTTQVSLYNLAECFVFPSLYEGFGMPVLEAMACGTPVVTSLTSSLPEVAGDAGLLINPLDSSEIADAISRVLSDAVLNAGMKQKNDIQAKKFSWEASANIVYNLYQTLL